MEQNKSSFFWPQGILIALVTLVGSLSLGLMLLVKPNASDAQSKQNINENNIAAKTGTQQRIEGLKAAMLTTWEKEATAKGLSVPVPCKLSRYND